MRTVRGEIENEGNIGVIIVEGHTSQSTTQKAMALIQRKIARHSQGTQVIWREKWISLHGSVHT